MCLSGVYQGGAVVLVVFVIVSDVVFGGILRDVARCLKVF